MVHMRQMINEGFIKVGFPKNISSIYGAKISYSLDGNKWHPCAIFPFIDDDRFLRCTFWEWNEAVRFGNIKFNGKAHPIYWNLYLNNLHQCSQDVLINAEIITERGIAGHRATLRIRPVNAVYISDWENRIQKGWKVENGCFAFAGGKEVQPFVIKPNLSGKYRVYFGLLYGIINMRVSSGDEKIRYPFIAERNRPEFQNKYHKEIYWKTVELNNSNILEISPTPLTIRHPDMYPFGAIHYLKLVPVETDEPAFRMNLKWKDKILACYFEPYSWAFCYNLNKKSEVYEAIKLFVEMGANQIHTQAIRFGSKTLHHSRIVERHSCGAMRGDDGTFSPGPASMVRSLDVLRESINACRSFGIIHYANAGLTNCYPGTDFEEKISREHPEWRTGNILRYNIPETRRYAAAIIKEFIEWGTDGISIDCMRYPYYHTEEDLLLLFYEIHEAIRKTSGKKKIPLTARIPAGDPLYYRVFENLAKKGIVQCVVPSNLLSREPHVSLRPYIRFKDFGCKVFGIIDGWLTHMGSYFNFQLSLYRYPSDIKDDIGRFFKEGADGIFVYQTDLYCADPFTRNIPDWNRWQRS